MRLAAAWMLTLAGCAGESASANAASNGNAPSEAAKAEIAATNVQPANVQQSSARSDMSQTAFLASCRQSRPELEQESAEWVEETCRTRWTDAQASRPMADAMLSLTPAPGSPAPTLAAVRAALPQVSWQARSDYLGAIATGDIRRGPLRGAYVIVKGSANSVWYIELSAGVGPEEGHPLMGIGDAMRIRGAATSTIGCTVFSEVLRFDLEGRAPFLVESYADFGSRGGTRSIRIHLGTPIPDLAALNAGRWSGGGENQEPTNEWRPACRG